MLINGNAKNTLNQHGKTPRQQKTREIKIEKDREKREREGKEIESKYHGYSITIALAPIIKIDVVHVGDEK